MTVREEVRPMVTFAVTETWPVGWSVRLIIPADPVTRSATFIALARLFLCDFVRRLIRAGLTHHVARHRY